MGKKRGSERPRRETRKQARLRRKEAEQRKWVLIGLGILGVLVVGILAWGLIDQYVIQPRTPIAVVDGTPIPTDVFQRRLAYEHWVMQRQLQQWLDFQAQFDPKRENEFLNQQINFLAARVNDVEGLSLDVLERMIDEVLIREEAARRGIQATDEEVQRQIELAFGFDRQALQAQPVATVTPTTTPTLTPTVTPTPAGELTPSAETPTPTPVPTPTPMTEEDFQRLYQEYVQRIQEQALGFSEAEFRSLFEVEVLRDKLTQVLCTDIPTTEEAVHVRHILIAVKTPTPEPVGEGTPTPTPDPKLVQQAEEEALKKAEEVKARLEAGEDFAALAKEFSDDPFSASQGGDLGWIGRGFMPKEFEDVAFRLEPGQTSDPVKTALGYHIIQVLEKDPERPRDEAAIQADRQKCFEDWLAKRREEATIERHWSPDRIPKALRQQG